MSTEIELRARFEEATRDVPTGPDLETSISRGRRARRRRTAVIAGGVACGVAGLAVATVLTGLAVGGPDSSGDRVATEPPASGTSTDEDFVTGTDHDELIEQVVARHLPTLPPPDDVYPSDWDHAGPMSDADAADATDWQAAYAVAPGESMLVVSGYAPPDEEADPGCPDKRARSHEPRCVRTQAPTGGWITDDGYTTADAYVFSSTYAAPSGFTVTVLQTVAAGSWQEATERRSLAPGDLHPLLTDPDLAFPLPASRH